MFLAPISAAVEVVGMNLQVSGQLADTLGQNGDLHLGGAGIGSVGAIVLDDRGLLVFQHHSVYPPFDNFAAPLRRGTGE